MTEDVLNKIPMEDLFDFMMQATKELVTIINKNDEDRTEYDAKLKDVELLQSLIAAKRAQEKAGLLLKKN